MTIIKILARILRAIMTLLACLSVMLFFGEVNAYSDGIIEVLDFLKYCGLTFISFVAICLATISMNHVVKYAEKIIQIRKKIQKQRNRIIVKAKFADIHY